MNWNHLYCFYEVARHNSLKRAAFYLGNAPSTISEQVKKLEKSLDVTLFDRSGRELFLTKDGESVFLYAKEIFEKGKRLIDAFGHNEVAGYSVQVGIENHLECACVYKFMGDYWSIYSNFGVVETKRSKNLSQSMYFLDHGVTDWVISTTSINDESFSSVKIESLSYGFYCSEQLKSSGMSAKEILATTPMATFGSSTKESTLIKNQLLNNGISINEELNSDHPDFLMSLCRSSKVILLIPASESVAMGGLVSILPEFRVQIPIYAIYKTSNEKLLFIKKLKELALSSRQEVDKNIINKYLGVNQWRTEFYLDSETSH